MDINKYFKKHLKFNSTGGYKLKQLVPKIVCADGFSMSVQASSTHYCQPREDEATYTHVEVGFPSMVELDLMPHAEDKKNPTGTVYGYVPVEIVEGVVEKHGGVKNVAKDAIIHHFNDTILSKIDR